MPGFNRRQLFRLRLGDLSREVGKVVGGKDGSEEEGEPFVRPPGALEDEQAFQDTCERCGACADACPHGIIRKFGPAFGPLEDTPYLEPEVDPCRWCEEMPCIAACPSGALTRKQSAMVLPIAKVSIDRGKCLNSQGVLCDTCSWRCPTHLKAIRMVNRFPVLDLEKCTGCGLCIYHCEAEPGAIALVHLELEAERENC